MENSKEEINKKRIEEISEETFKLIKEKLKQEEFSKELVQNLLDVDVIEPKKEVITQKEFSKSIEILGWIIIAGCIVYFIYFFSFLQYFEPLTYTTYITTILIGITCIRRFTSYLFNSITCISFYGFFAITLAYFPSDLNIELLIVGPILHGAMAGFQIFLILHKKIPVSKRYLLWGFLFYLLFLSSFDRISRLNRITGLDPEVYPDVFIAVLSFFGLSISIFLIYIYKKRYGILIP